MGYLTFMESTRQSEPMAEIRILRAPESLRRNLRMRALAEDTTMNDLVIQLLQDAMKGWTVPQPKKG